MSVQKKGKESVRKLQNSKGSYYITLPIKEVRKLSWREGQKLVVKRQGNKFVVSDWEK